MALEAAAKFLTYAGTLLAVGTSASFWLIARPYAWEPTDARAAVIASLRRSGVFAAMLAVFGLTIRAWAHTAEVVGLADSWTADAWQLVVIESRWGSGWRWQMVAALACLALFVPARRTSRSWWRVRAAATFALAISLPLNGHAARQPAPSVVHSVHILAGGIWLGALAVLMRLRRVIDESRRREIFNRFSGAAMFAVAVLVLTGVGASWLYVGSLSNLTTTEYGRLLLFKVALAAAAAACGYVNWRTLRGGAAEPGGAATIELLAALAIIVVTSVLTELEHP